ncbi:MAG: hypothetical protein GYA23_11800 [Methanomicrobiales archaeon]|nr:hypothetical protein [Methanomicrobiales archaeon]
MDLLEFIILVLVLCTVIFLVYYFFRGQKGEVSLARPVESRIDEYLDRRFQTMVDEWELVPHARLDTFMEKNTRLVEQDEKRVAELKEYEKGLETTLTSLEARLDALEKELATKGSTKK